LYAYVDKTGRLAATTYIENYLEIGEGYTVGQEIEVITYGKGGEKTVRVAIDGKYQGIILGNEHYADIYPGDKFKARVKKIYEDGIVGVTTRKKRLDERDELKDQILDYLKNHDGFMSYNDKTSPQVIKEIFGTSKNYFKMTLGGLMKEGKIEQSSEGTRLKK
jgi:predicted RNA-binding protein (virulence factor B family)